MIGAFNRLLDRAGRSAIGLRLDTDEVVPGILRIRSSSRATRAFGMQATSYLFGTTLVDAGFSRAAAAFVPFLAGRRISGICLTHHHEDHSGNSGVLAERHGCPVWLRNADRHLEEGLADLKPYRRLSWGVPSPYRPVEMPPVIPVVDGTLRPVPIPGHSVTHTAFLHEPSSAAFTGDLFVTGGTTGVMFHENPYESIASLRRVADLEPRWMLTGHGLAVEAPAEILRRKADAIERDAERVRSLRAEGASETEIVRRVFRRGRSGDWVLDTLSQGEFSRACFVRACLRHAPGFPAAPRRNGRA